MNKKGFTLVELLAVIAVLGIIVTLVSTIGTNSFGKAKEKINIEEKKNIDEAVKNILVEVENCDDDTEDYKELKELFDINKSKVSNCDTLKKELNLGSKKVYLDKLESKGYVSSEVDNYEYYINFDYTTNKGSIASSIGNYTYSKNLKSSSSNSCSNVSIGVTLASAGEISFQWKIKGSYDSTLLIDNTKVNTNRYNTSGTKKYSLSAGEKKVVGIQFSAGKSGDYLEISDIKFTAKTTEFYHSSASYQWCLGSFTEVDP